MRQFIFLIAVLSVLFYVSVFAEKDPNSKIEIPDVLGGFKKTKVIDNEPKDPGLGTTVHYHCPGIKATVYIYNMGINTIPDGIESNVVRKAFETAKANIQEVARQGYYKLSSKLRTSITILDPAENPISALTASFSYQDQRENLTSFLYVFGRKNHIIKIRFSGEAENEAALNSIREGFLKDIAKWMK